jgi:hypothetical protein
MTDENKSEMYNRVYAELSAEFEQTAIDLLKWLEDARKHTNARQQANVLTTRLVTTAIGYFSRQICGVDTPLHSWSEAIAVIMQHKDAASLQSATASSDEVVADVEPTDVTDIDEGHKQNHVIPLRNASGNRESKDPLVLFLYLLMRDKLPTGEVEQLTINTLEAIPKDGVLFTNGFLVDYATNITERLQDASKPKPKAAKT